MIGRVRGTLQGRLLAGQLLVILAGAATLGIVALAIAPGRFHHHVQRALGPVSDEVTRHLDTAFGQSILFALGIAVAASVVTALAVSAFMAARIVRPVRSLAASADHIAAGAYSSRVPAQGEDELAALGRSFNRMAGSLEATEARRAQLLADLGHELRTPVATIAGYVEGLRDGVVPATAATWDVLDDQTRRLGRLVDDVRRVSSAEDVGPELQQRRVAPAELLNAAAERMSPRYGAKGVTLALNIADATPAVDVDPDRLGEVLDNLLDNALRHTPRGGRVELAAAARGNTVELSVTDTGDGLSSEDLEHLFERFYRGDRARAQRDEGGSGIGLTIARAIVSAHGGSLNADSDGPGSGSRFVARLPRPGA